MTSHREWGLECVYFLKSEWDPWHSGMRYICEETLYRAIYLTLKILLIYITTNPQIGVKLSDLHNACVL